MGYARLRDVTANLDHSRISQVPFPSIPKITKHGNFPNRDTISTYKLNARPHWREKRGSEV